MMQLILQHSGHRLEMALLMVPLKPFSFVLKNSRAVEVGLQDEQEHEQAALGAPPLP